MSPLEFDVIVATYNGSRFIEAQIQSILDQSSLPKSIVVTDDGSTDQTLATIKKMAESHPGLFVFIQGPKQGVVANVLHAFAHTSAEYVFIADQDDIWLPNKIDLFSKKMINSSYPHLIYSDAIVWGGGEKTGVSFFNSEKIPKRIIKSQHLLFRNSVQGASSAVNRAVILKLRIVDDIYMHDWWMALIASFLGEMTLIEVPTLLYRQHDSNLVGSSLVVKRGYGAKYRASIKIFLQAMAFYDVYKVVLNVNDEMFLRELKRVLLGGFMRRLRFLVVYQPKRLNFTRSLTLWVSILLFKSA